MKAWCGAFACLKATYPISRLGLAIVRLWPTPGYKSGTKFQLLDATTNLNYSTHGFNYRHITAGLPGARCCPHPSLPRMSGKYFEGWIGIFIGVVHYGAWTSSTLISYWMLCKTQQWIIAHLRISMRTRRTWGKQDISASPEENRLVWNHCKGARILQSTRL